MAATDAAPPEGVVFLGTGAFRDVPLQGPAAVDWNALAAQMLANLTATGQWFVGDGSTPTPPQPPAEMVDWNAMAAQVNADFAATGHWFA